MRDILITILIIIFLVVIITFKKKSTEKFETQELSSYSRFITDLQKYKKKKKYILVFTGGPTLKEFKKEHISKEIYDNAYIIAVKNSINFLDEIGITPDFCVSNFEGSAKRINIDILKKYKTVNIASTYDVSPKIPELKKYFNYIVKLFPPKKKNLMELVINDMKDLDFKNINNEIYTGWGHIMMELALPLCIFLETKNIITIGWDNNPKIIKHWDNIENFDNITNDTNWASSDVICNKFSPYLHDYLWKHYKIRIYKINKNSTMKIPLLNK
jgi:hypothetical protein